MATDLNPVAVTINKGLIEIPSRFAGRPPVGSAASGGQGAFGSQEDWKGTAGLRADIKRYGRWVLDQARDRLGRYYPNVQVTPEMAANRPDLAPLVAQELPVIAYLWARVIESPNPAYLGVQVPLVSSFFLSTKKNRLVWSEPVIDGRSFSFKVRTGTPKDRKAVQAGTKVGRGAFGCLFSGAHISTEYIRAEGMAGRLGTRLIAVVCDSSQGRVYLEPTAEASALAESATPDWRPGGEVPSRLTGGTCYGYGFTTFGDLYTDRQLVSLTTLLKLIGEARALVQRDARAAGWSDGVGLESGGRGAIAYGEALAVYLAAALDKVSEYNNQLVVWYAKESRPKGVFARHALPMVWDFAEANPLAPIGGGWERSVQIVAESLGSLFPAVPGVARLSDAASPWSESRVVICTDPPYYDNIGYADLSDFFYGWLRRSLSAIYPRLFGTIQVPKAAELVASTYRHGGKQQAELHFLRGMSIVLERMAAATDPTVPVCIYYAFKQAELRAEGIQSTGWETFLNAVLSAGFAVTGTWPIRTERGSRSIGIGKNALASSIVLVCRKREPDAPVVSRGGFRRLLSRELSGALRQLQEGSIAPVDLAQASVGPGMAVFSRHTKVLENDGSSMSVKSALQLIHEVVDELGGEEETTLDLESRFAVIWFEAFGFEPGPYGDAETLAKARTVSVAGVVEAGLCTAVAGRVQLTRRTELPPDWDPQRDACPTVWEATQHLIRTLETQGEAAAADLLGRIERSATIGPLAESARLLAYRLYSICERKSWAEEARAYNLLALAWPELVQLSAKSVPSAPRQTQIF